MYASTKKFPPISCAFRQWRAHSHCKFIHGYALTFRFEFEADDLDTNHWVVDFGSLKSLRGLLENSFDHRTLIAEDDPELETFRNLDTQGIIQLHVVEATGCEKFAEAAFEVGDQWIRDAGYGDRCRVRSVEVWEHESNSARYEASPNRPR